MAKITRKHQKIFALTNDDSQRFGNGQFGSGKSGTKVITDDVETLQLLPAFDNGWKDAVLVNGAGQPTLPPLPEMQALNYICTYQIAYLFQEGIPEYNADTTYYIDSIAKAPGTYNLYGSIVDDNIGNSVSDPTKWKYLVNLSTAVMTANTSSVANEIVLYDGIGGRDIKRATTTGILKGTSGVLSAAVEGVDYYAPGGTEVAIADGGTGQSTAAAAFAALKQDATTSATGVVELATTAETQAGTDTTRAITPAGLKGALTFSNVQESSEIAVTAGSASNFAHGLGAIPNFIQIFLRCKTAEQNYSVNDEVYWGGYGFAVNNSATGMSIACDATNIYTIVAAGSTGITLLNKTTGAGFNATLADWRMVIRYG